MRVTCRDAHVAEWGPPPQAGSEVGCCLLCPSCGWARLNPQLCVYGGEGGWRGSEWVHRSNGEECCDHPAAFPVGFPFFTPPRSAAAVLRASCGAGGAVVLAWQQLCGTCWDCSVLRWEMAHAPGQPDCDSVLLPPEGPFCIPCVLSLCRGGGGSDGWLCSEQDQCCRQSCAVRSPRKKGCGCGYRGMQAAPGAEQHRGGWKEGGEEALQGVLVWGGLLCLFPC